MAETTVTVAASTSGRLSAGGLYGKRLWHHVGCGRPHIDPDPAEPHPARSRLSPMGVSVILESLDVVLWIVTLRSLVRH